MKNIKYVFLIFLFFCSCSSIDSQLGYTSITKVDLSEIKLLILKDLFPHDKEAGTIFVENCSSMEIEAIIKAFKNDVPEIETDLSFLDYVESMAMDKRTNTPACVVNIDLESNTAEGFHFKVLVYIANTGADFYMYTVQKSSKGWVIINKQLEWIS